MPASESPNRRRTRSDVPHQSDQPYWGRRGRRVVLQVVSAVAACSLLVIGLTHLPTDDPVPIRIVTAGEGPDATPSPSPITEPSPLPTPSPTPISSPLGPVKGTQPAAAPANPAGGLTVLPPGTGITEFPLPDVIGYGGNITAGPDGALWFIKGYGLNALVRMTTDGSVTALPTTGSTWPVGGPQATALAVGEDGAFWFTEGSQIGRMTMDGAVTRFPIPGGVSPVAVVEGAVGSSSGGAWSIVAGPDGALWFNECGGDRIGRITTTGEMSEFELPDRGSEFGCPNTLTVGPDDALWFTTRRAVWRLDPASKAFTAFEVPEPFGTVHLLDIAAGPDGALWMSTPTSLLRMTPAGSWTSLPLPAQFTELPAANVVNLTAGQDGRMWFTNTGRNAVGYVDRNDHITEIPVSTPDSRPVSMTIGPDGAVWFTMAGRHSGIGRIEVPR